jgi:hypothetical protein
MTNSRAFARSWDILPSSDSPYVPLLTNREGNDGTTDLLPTLQVLLLGFPIQMVLVKVMFTQRKKGVKLTDTRVRLTTEVCAHFPSCSSWNYMVDMDTRAYRSCRGYG